MAELLRRLKEEDKEFREGTKMGQIKFVERAGTSVRDLLVTSNPWGDMKCGRQKCFVCKSEGAGIGKCMKENVLYSIRCNECRERERESEYWGETGRDCYSRGGEHLSGFREQREDNPMWKHGAEIHEGQGDEDMFTMKMEMGFKKPLARQIRERVEIEMSTKQLMNSKAEWNNARIP